MRDSLNVKNMDPFILWKSVNLVCERTRSNTHNICMLRISAHISDDCVCACKSKVLMEGAEGIIEAMQSFMPGSLNAKTVNPFVLWNQPFSRVKERSQTHIDICM